MLFVHVGASRTPANRTVFCLGLAVWRALIRYAAEVRCDGERKSERRTREWTAHYLKWGTLYAFNLTIREYPYRSCKRPSKGQA